jgi:hypothetical protein
MDYYKIESHDVLLKYIKKKGLVLNHGDDDEATRKETFYYDIQGFHQPYLYKQQV